MSDYKIGEREDDWILRNRAGQLELWKNEMSGDFGIYRCDSEGQSERRLLYAVRGGESEAWQVFNTASAILM